MGIVTVFYLTDRPQQASWLSSEEREWITFQLGQEKTAKQKVHSYSVWQAFGHRDVILLTLCYFFALTGNYGVAFWLPTLLKRLSGQSDMNVTLLASLPYLAGFLVQQLNGWHSDRTHERRWHAALPALLSGVFLLFAIRFGSSVPLSMVFFTLADSLRNSGYLFTRTRSFSLGLWYLLSSFFVSGCLMLLVGSRRRSGGRNQMHPGNKVSESQAQE